MRDSGLEAVGVVIQMYLALRTSDGIMQSRNQGQPDPLSQALIDILWLVSPEWHASSAHKSPLPYNPLLLTAPVRRQCETVRPVLR